MKKPSAAHSRFLMWVDKMRCDGYSRPQIAVLLGVSDATIYGIGSGRRSPSRHLAMRIERETAHTGSTIATTEWPRTKRGGKQGS